jgi:aspartate/glutamate racemase
METLRLIGGSFFKDKLSERGIEPIIPDIEGRILLMRLYSTNL